MPRISLRRAPYLDAEGAGRSRERPTRHSEAVSSGVRPFTRISVYPLHTAIETVQPNVGLRYNTCTSQSPCCMLHRECSLCISISHAYSGPVPTPDGSFSTVSLAMIPATAIYPRKRFIFMLGTSDTSTFHIKYL